MKHKTPQFLADRLRNNARDLSTVPPYDLASSRTLKCTIRDLEEAATVLEEIAAAQQPAPEKSDLERLRDACPDDDRDEDDRVKLRTNVEGVEIVTTWGAMFNQFITVRTLEGGSVQILRQADTAHAASVNHLEVASQIKDGTFTFRDPPKDPSRYGVEHPAPDYRNPRLN